MDGARPDASERTVHVGDAKEVRGRDSGYDAAGLGQKNGGGIYLAIGGHRGHGYCKSSL
jgi:hypothetical protein